MCIIKAKLCTIREEPGGYTIYVFENLERKEWNHHYVKVVKFRNWETPLIRIGDLGYLEYQEVLAGKDTWWDKETQTNISYNYDMTIFKDFVHERAKKDLTVMLLITL